MKKPIICASICFALALLGSLVIFISPAVARHNGPREIFNLLKEAYAVGPVVLDEAFIWVLLFTATATLLGYCYGYFSMKADSGSKGFPVN
jgi:hypothetical protein